MQTLGCVLQEKKKFNKKKGANPRKTPNPRLDPPRRLSPQQNAVFFLQIPLFSLRFACFCDPTDSGKKEGILMDAFFFGGNSRARNLRLAPLRRRSPQQNAVSFLQIPLFALRFAWSFDPTGSANRKGTPCGVPFLLVETAGLEPATSRM